jgi:hypothetical protein
VLEYGDIGYVYDNGQKRCAINKVTKASDNDNEVFQDLRFTTTRTRRKKTASAVSCKLPPLKSASNTRLNVEGSIMSLPFAIVRQVKVIPMYNLRGDLQNLGHSNLTALLTEPKTRNHRDLHSFRCTDECQHQN